MKGLRRAPGAERFKNNRTDDLIEAIREAIQSIPRGKVSSYGLVAAAAGYPRHVRMVPRVLNIHGDGLPWHRVLGADGLIKVPTESKQDQKLRLQSEGVRFRGGKVDMTAHQHVW